MTWILNDPALLSVSNFIHLATGFIAGMAYVYALSGSGGGGES